jgi:methyl-accepting chemotaxis protein
MQKHLKEIVKFARYGKSGYFWINDMNLTMVMHPIRPEYDGKSFANRPLVPFVGLGLKKLQQTKKQETFIKYRFFNPSTKKYDFKISMIKIFQPYGWIIGTGSYLSDVTPELQKQALKNIEALRYGKSGYFWINDMNYTMIMHPIKPQYNAQHFPYSKEVPSVSLGVDALKKSGKTSAIIRYKFYNPATKMYEEKLSVVHLFEPWNWVIGTGVYLNNLHHSIAQMQKNRIEKEEYLIYKVLGVGCCILVFAIFLAHYLTQKFIIKPMEVLDLEKQHFKEMSQIDYLTNILNRRAFYTQVQQYLSYAHRNNLRVSVLMIDIDFFKKVNDTYGHEAGDAVLKAIVDIVKRSVRKEDIFGRLGGEEFGLCLLNIDENALVKMAEKIRKNIQEHTIYYEGHEIQVTVSLGGYTLQTYLEEFDEVFKKADNALYEAKTKGRNRFQSFEN